MIIKELSNPIVNLFCNQGFAIVSSFDQKGGIHCSAKGIVDVDRNKVYLIDLYRAVTFSNLKPNPIVTITVVDETEFVGFALKGTAAIVERKDLAGQTIEKWEQRLVGRISKRVIKNIKKDKGSSLHPESHFPQPQYLIEVEVKEVVDLTPAHLKKDLT